MMDDSRMLAGPLSRRGALRFAACAAVAGLLSPLMAPAARAHHGWNSFDTRHAYFVAGRVTRVHWGNPHSEANIRVETTELPANWLQRPLPPGADEENGRLTMASARPYAGKHQVVELALAGPGWMERWGLKRPLQVGETIEAVGFLSTRDDSALRPVMFWLADGQGIWQQLTAFPRRPEPAAR